MVSWEANRTLQTDQSKSQIFACSWQNTVRGTARWFCQSNSISHQGFAHQCKCRCCSRTGLPLGPSSPGGPRRPAGPAAPGGPVSPFSPVSPFLPWRGQIFTKEQMHKNMISSNMRAVSNKINAYMVEIIVITRVIMLIVTEMAAQLASQSVG